MIKVFTAGGRDASRLGGSWAGLIAILVFCASFHLSVDTRAQTPKDVEPPKTKEQVEDEAKAAAEEDAKAAAADPSETHKGASTELLMDPSAQDMLDLKKFSPIRAQREATSAEFTLFKQMAVDPLVTVDPKILAVVVDTMIAKLTNHKNIEAVLDVSGAAPNAAASKAIQEATAALMEPVFQARNTKNTQFQAAYNRILAQKLPPVLKNHLVPRIQAMIILGQSANIDAYKTFLDEIKNPDQTVWVKLWAFRGLTNIKQFSNKLSTSQEIDAAKTVADALAKNKLWPWPVQLRGLETLAVMRQGFSPTSPRTADMAATAFQYLTDETLRPEVRAEAALALGLMQMTNQVPKYNVMVIAHAAGQLAADIGDRIASGFSENKLRAQKLTTLLMGPVLQTFEGQTGLRESGLLNNVAAASNKPDTQKYDDAIRPVAQAAIALAGGPTGQIKANTDALKASVAALKAFLEKNPPANLELFQGGPKLPAPGGAVAEDAPPAGEEKDEAKKGAPEQASATKGRGNQ